jgi:hypothetical protein
MPSWNEKPHFVPTVNVNLMPCDCGAAHPDLYPPADPQWGDKHRLGCAQTPVDIPCPLPPSVTFKVQIAPISECIFPCTWTSQYHHGPHHEKCPARPVRVSCSITSSDGSWERSEVADDCAARVRLPAPYEVSLNSLRQAAGDRWALIKALVTGHTDLSALLTGPRALELLAQRDAVFSALVRMERGNTEVLGGIEDFDKALTRRKRTSPIESISGPMLTYYVQHLIEQVGAIS